VIGFVGSVAIIDVDVSGDATGCDVTG